jgi:hypothetical protein
MAIFDQMMVLFWISAQWRKEKEDGYVKTNIQL